MTMTRFAELAAKEDWLAVLVTTDPDSEPAVSLVNVAVFGHPVGGGPVLAFVSRGRTRKLANLRRTGSATVVVRSGWDWLSVSCRAEIAGPDDPLPGVPAASLPRLLCDIYTSAGGHHSDLAEYDREMVADRRAAVLLTPQRFVTNPVPHDREAQD